MMPEGQERLLRNTITLSYYTNI